MLDSQLFAAESDKRYEKRQTQNESYYAAHFALDSDHRNSSKQETQDSQQHQVFFGNYQQQVDSVDMWAEQAEVKNKTVKKEVEVSDD